MTIEKNLDTLENQGFSGSQKVENFLMTLKEIGIDAEHIILNAEAHNVAEVRTFLNNPDVTDEIIIKTLVMILDDVEKIILLPGNKKIDFKKLKELTKAELMRMAEYDEVEKIGQVGAIFPFDIEVEIFIDQTLIQKEKVLINLGTLKDYAFIQGKDLEKIKNSKIADLI
ncbi:YbaK/EbsC family protein [Candidatus Pacearchaeota archaeon]|nr:YbaK/EbsC family protein [Candidatus Pacearchaeota archaeon]